MTMFLSQLYQINRLGIMNEKVVAHAAPNLSSIKDDRKKYQLCFIS